MLPTLFQMDDYKECLHYKKIFCKVDAHLQPTNNDSEIWKIIEGSLKNQENFDRSVLHRGYCFTSQEAQDVESLKRYSEVMVNQEIFNTNLSSKTIDVLACTDGLPELSSFDKILITFVLLYVSFIIVATYKDFEGKRRGKPSSRIYEHFSLNQSWKKRVNPLKNDDSEKLKSIQGIRCYNLLLILFFHIKLGYVIHYMENPSWIEEVKPLWNLLFVFYMFVVLTFILISSWLLTNQILGSHQKHGYFSLKHAGIMIVNRYFRTAVVCAFSLALFSSSLVQFLSGPLSLETSNPHKEICRRNWLSSLLFINNFEYISNMCNGVSWYLAADFQIYILTIIVLYMILKFKLDFMKVLVFIMVLTSFFYAAIIYIYDMDIIFRPSARNLERRHFFYSLSFIVSYSSTYSILNCGSIGAIFGMIYFKNKDKQFNTNWVSHCIWALLFFGLPLMSVLISSAETKGITAAILGPLVKPLFVSGIGIGILGMSHGMGGIIKKICEWKFAVIIANFSYSIYLFQIPIVFFNALYGYFPLKMGYSTIILDFIFSVPTSFILGGIITLFLEEPGITLQKMLLPQIKKDSNKTKEDDTSSTVDTKKLK